MLISCFYSKKSTVVGALPAVVVGVTLSGRRESCWWQWGAWGPPGREEDGGAWQRGQDRASSGGSWPGLGPQVGIGPAALRPSRGQLVK